MVDNRCVLTRHNDYEELKILTEYFKKGINNAVY